MPAKRERDLTIRRCGAGMVPAFANPRSARNLFHSDPASARPPMRPPSPAHTCFSRDRGHGLRGPLGTQEVVLWKRRAEKRWDTADPEQGGRGTGGAAQRECGAADSPPFKIFSHAALSRDLLGSKKQRIFFSNVSSPKFDSYF